MNTKLHIAWERALELCDLLELDSEQIAHGVPMIESQMAYDHELYRIQDRVLEAALLLRQMVDRDERSKYWPRKETASA